MLAKVTDSGGPRGPCFEFAPPFPAGIVAKIDASEAYGAIHHMRTIILATVPCVLALGICASYLLSRIFTAPITKLDKVARALADGDLSARAKGASWEMHDEIGGLRDTFNEMADQMAKLYSTLESR